MNNRLFNFVFGIGAMGVCFLTPVQRGAAAPPAIIITDISVNNHLQEVIWSLIPAVDRYEFLSTPSFGVPFSTDSTGTNFVNRWVGPLRPPAYFHRVRAIATDPNAVLAGLVLKRLAYGPTPDDIERVLTGSSPIGALAYIDEQLAPELIDDSEVEQHPSIKGPKDKLMITQADDEEIRSWHAMRAVMSKRQLLEVLLMFFDTHFNTMHDKSKDWLQGRSLQDPEYRWQATDFEYRDIERWRAKLLDPNGTFGDMALISSKSPAMIVYLDTVINRKNVPNENYSREIMELFTMGVDNGYTQKDIEEMSKAWTGWRVEKKLAVHMDDPHAPVAGDGPAALGTVWTLHFDVNSYAVGAKTIFQASTVDPRFGIEYTSKIYGANTTPGKYELKLPSRSGTAGYQDGLDIVAHLSDLPYTQEFVSVKLCQWFVHERFAPGYDFTSAELSAEGKLIKECMKSWRTPGPDGRQGNLRSVLRTIFRSELFLSQGAVAHKVKTPLEFVASSIRVLRVKKPDGTFTSDTDGYSFKEPLIKMGGMKLFDREEPDGWPETGIGWMNTANIGERLRFVQSFLMKTGTPKKIDYPGSNKNVSDPVALLKLKLAPSKLSDATEVVNYFMTLLYPGEGKANLSWSSKEAISYLNSDATGAPNSSLFSALDPNSAAYDERIRGAVAYMMALPRFQEQ